MVQQRLPSQRCMVSCPPPTLMWPQRKFPPQKETAGCLSLRAHSRTTRDKWPATSRALIGKQLTCMCKVCMCIFVERITGGIVCMCVCYLDSVYQERSKELSICATRIYTHRHTEAEAKETKQMAKSKALQSDRVQNHTRFNLDKAKNKM